MRILKNIVLCFVFISAAYLLFGSVSRVDAMPILSFDVGVDGSFDFSVADQGSDDTDGDLGQIGFSGMFGTYPNNFNVSVGGDASSSMPDMTLGGSVTPPSAGGMIQIAISETGYDAAGIDGFLTGMIGTTIISLGTTTVEYKLFVGLDDMHWTDGGNFEEISSLTATGGFVAPMGTDSVDSDEWDSVSSMLVGNTFSLTLVATVSHTPGSVPFASVNLNARAKSVVTDVPEPATAVLLGMGLAGLCGGGYLRRRRIRKQ